jgi:hypothetical protein
MPLWAWHIQHHKIMEKMFDMEINYSSLLEYENATLGMAYANNLIDRSS